MKGAPCVYELHFESGWTGTSKTNEEAAGLFSVKCYPHPDASVFQHFSREEQAFVLSDCFDSTGTPRFEFLDRIPPHLFNVATIEYACGPDEAWSMLTLESLDSMLTRHEVGTTFSNALIHETITWTAGEVIRKIPAWDLGYGLFDLLISLYAFHYKTGPIRVIHTATPGFEIIYDENSAHKCRETSDISGLSLGILFLNDAHANLSQAESFIQDAWGEGSRTIIFDKTFPSNSFTAAFETPLLNRQWWKAANERYKFNLASGCSCGCS